jgi:hypothetical protein
VKHWIVVDLADWTCYDRHVAYAIRELFERQGVVVIVVDHKRPSRWVQ